MRIRTRSVCGWQAVLSVFASNTLVELRTVYLRNLCADLGTLAEIDKWIADHVCSVELVACRSYDEHLKDATQRAQRLAEDALEQTIQLKNRIAYFLCIGAPGLGPKSTDYRRLRNELANVKYNFDRARYAIEQVLEEDARNVSGISQTVELHGACPYVLRDETKLKRIAVEAAQRENFKIQSVISKKLADSAGSTVALILSQSGLIFDTWPEHNYAAFVMVACGRRSLNLLGFLKESVGASRAQVNVEGRLKIKWIEHNEHECVHCGKIRCSASRVCREVLEVAAQG